MLKGSRKQTGATEYISSDDRYHSKVFQPEISAKEGNLGLYIFLG